MVEYVADDFLPPGERGEKSVTSASAMWTSDGRCVCLRTVPVRSEPDAAERLAVRRGPAADRIEVWRPPGDPVLVPVPQLLPRLGTGGAVVVEARAGEAEVCYGGCGPEDVVSPGGAATQPVQGMLVLADSVDGGG